MIQKKFNQEKYQQVEELMVQEENKENLLLLIIKKDLKLEILI
jgi:hypothetical protein